MCDIYETHLLEIFYQDDA